MIFFCCFDTPYHLEEVLISKGWYFDVNYALRKHDANIKIHGLLVESGLWLVEIETDCIGIYKCLEKWRGYMPPSLDVN